MTNIKVKLKLVKIFVFRVWVAANFSHNVCFGQSVLKREFEHTVILLWIGGSKRTQARDIEKAKRYGKDFQEQYKRKIERLTGNDEDWLIKSLHDKKSHQTEFNEAAHFLQLYSDFLKLAC